jgi:hypothetical protein
MAVSCEFLSFEDRVVSNSRPCDGVPPSRSFDLVGLFPPLFRVGVRFALEPDAERLRFGFFSLSSPNKAGCSFPSAITSSKVFFLLQ